MMMMDAKASNHSDRWLLVAVLARSGQRMLLRAQRELFQNTKSQRMKVSNVSKRLRTRRNASTRSYSVIFRTFGALVCTMNCPARKRPLRAAVRIV